MSAGAECGTLWSMPPPDASLTLLPQEPASAPAPPADDRQSLYLVVVAGQPRPALELDPAARGASGDGILLGRQEGCALQVSAEQVSRRHARFRHDPHAGVWSIHDQGSRWGTVVNGRRLDASVGRGSTPLSPGDLVRIAPWTFLVSVSPRPRGTRAIEGDARAGSSVRSVDAAALPALQQGRLELLLSSAATLQDATDERELAERLLSLAQEGTHLRNAAVLRALDAEGRYDVLAISTPAGHADEGFSFSRTLLDHARDGEVAEVHADAMGGSQGDDPSQSPYSQSIVQMQITRAVCVPILLGPTPSLFLYLDQRGDTFTGVADESGATAYCVALGRVASLALSNLKRLDMERRAAEVDADVKAAAAAQQWIMPRGAQRFGGYTVIGESRPGKGVGGDFFDVVELGPDRLAVALGDVSGKGMSAGVLMTAAQGYLNAVLDESCGGGCGSDRCAEGLAEAVSRLSRFIHPRRPATRFLTLWVGIFDAADGRLHYVDAGHGLGLIQRAGGAIEDLSSGGGVPIGILPDATYQPQSLAFGPGDRALIFSDGIAEQPRADYTADSRDEFDVPRVRRVLGAPAPDEGATIRSLFEAVVRHAGTDQLADDATAVLIAG